MQPDHLLQAAMVLVALALLLSFYRVIKGPSVADRVVASDLIGVSSVCLLILGATAAKESAFLDAAVVIALLGFLGTIAYARYAERKGRD